MRRGRQRSILNLRCCLDGHDACKRRVSWPTPCLADWLAGFEEQLAQAVRAFDLRRDSQRCFGHNRRSSTLGPFSHGHLMRATNLLAALLFAAGASAASAQSTSSGSTPEKEVVIRRLLEATRTAEMMMATIESGLAMQRASNPNIPPVFWDRFAARVRQERGALIDSIVPIYGRAFSLAELQQLLQFYQTPLGKRLVAATPDIARESMQAGQRWGMAIGQAIGEELQKEGIVPRPPNEHD